MNEGNSLHFFPVTSVSRCRVFMSQLMVKGERPLSHPFTLFVRFLSLPLIDIQQTRPKDWSKQHMGKMEKEKRRYLTTKKKDRKGKEEEWRERYGSEIDRSLTRC